jgi:hypothetical protein
LFSAYQVFNYSNEIYYNCFIDVNANGTKECLIPFTADLMDENNNKITNKTGAIKLIFEGPLEELKPNPDYIAPTQDGPSPSNYLQIAKIITPTFTRTGCELQIDEPCEVPDGYSFCGQCSYSRTSLQELPNRGKCWTCPSGTSCSGGNDNTHCGEVSCVSYSQNTNTPRINQQNYFASCSNCQKGSYRNYYYNGPDYYTCNYYSRTCDQSQCANKITNCQ